MPEASPLAAVMISGTTSIMFERKPFARAPKPRLDFIEDEQDAVLVADLAQALHEGDRRDNISTLAQHRFDQDGGGLFGSGLRGEQIFELFQRILGGFCFRHLQAEGIRERRDKHARRQRTKARAIDRLGCGQRHRAGRAPVEGAAEDDDVLPACGDARDLDRILQRFRAGVGKEEESIEGGTILRSSSISCSIGLWMTMIRLRMQEKPSLFADGFDHFRVAVTGIGHADAAGEVQQFPSIIGVDVGAFGALGNKVEDARPGGGHVREVFLIELIGCHDFLLDFKVSET